MNRDAFGIRPARTRPLEGGTTLSRLPQTTSVGAWIEPRNGMLDQFDTASDCHNRPNGSGSGQGLPSRDLPRLRRMSALLPGVAPMPHEVAARINPFTRCGASWASCWATAPPSEY